MDSMREGEGEGDGGKIWENDIETCKISSEEPGGLQSMGSRRVGHD